MSLSDPLVFAAKVAGMTDEELNAALRGPLIDAVWQDALHDEQRRRYHDAVVVGSKASRAVQPSRGSGDSLLGRGSSLSGI
jgi:hypothetical protein